MGHTTMTRRKFMQAASAVTAACAVGAVGCSPVKQTDEKSADDEPQEEIFCSSCRACISNCGVKVHVRDGRVVKIEGDERDPMSKGTVCAKGLAAIQALYNPNRMKYPMKRAGERGENKWERITWKEAVDTIVGTAGIKVLTSKDAKKVYSQTTAAVLRMKDCVMNTVTNVQEEAGDIYATAQEINEKRAVADAEQVVEDTAAEAAETVASDAEEA